MPHVESHPHGTRSRYARARCRCDACRRANTEYEKERQRARARGEWNGLVSAAPVRRHLEKLSQQGVGYRSAAAAASLSKTVVFKIVTGQRTRLRALSARALLAVDAGAAADHALIDARETMANVRWLLRHGLNRGEIAERMGNETPRLQIRSNRVIAATALRIARLRREVEAEIEASAGVVKVCSECGYSHRPADRQRKIARLVAEGVKSEDIVEAWPCFYPATAAGQRALYRDIAALREGGA
jgi:hypothetical protein